MADRPGDVADVFHTCFGVAGEWLKLHSLFSFERIRNVPYRVLFLFLFLVVPRDFAVVTLMMSLPSLI